MIKVCAILYRLFAHFVTIEIFLYVVGNTLDSMHKKSRVNRKSGKCGILRFNPKVVFFQWRRTFCCTNEMEAEGPFCNKYYPNCTILLEKHYMIYIHRYIQHEINVVSIFVFRFEVRQFQYLGIYRQIRPFENDYHRFKADFIKKSRHLKYQNAAFQKEQLFRNQVKCNMWPVKMATGHFPTGSHNFAWNGHVDIDGMTTVTLQTNYDPTLPRGNPKVAYPLEISSGSGIYSDAVCHLPAAQHRQRSNRPTTSMLFAVTSLESRGHHYGAPYDASFIYPNLKYLLPQNNTFFIATMSVVKDAVDTRDCQGLREQWYYLRFYVRRTMPPTGQFWSPASSQQAAMSARICETRLLL